MKTFLLALTAALGLGVVAQADDTPNPVTILVSGEPQTQMMSMVLTMQTMQHG